jgi:hypothetical protein
LNLPASYSALAANGQISWADALGTGSNARTLVLSIPGASLTASAVAGVTATGSGSATLTLSGTQDGLSAYLAAAGNLVLSGTAGQSYTLTVTDNVGATATATTTVTVTPNLAPDAVATTATPIAIAPATIHAAATRKTLSLGNTCDHPEKHAPRIAPLPARTTHSS